MSIGERIKRFRKNKSLTQSALAELIGVLTQAVSKWETDTGMPDISQIVPLARVLGVNTDMLLGFCSENDNANVIKKIEEARAETAQYNRYCRLIDAQKSYPNNIILLLEILECSIAMAYPENDCYDAIHADEVYRNSENISGMIIGYAENASDILRARMIMVALHSAHGNYEKAKEHLPSFPCRADMTLNNVSAYISHASGDFREEVNARKWELLYLY